MPKLRQITTGEIYPFMPGLASRPDMEVIEDEVSVTPEQQVVVESKQRGRPAKKNIADIDFKVSDEAE